MQFNLLCLNGELTIMERETGEVALIAAFEAAEEEFKRQWWDRLREANDGTE